MSIFIQAYEQDCLKKGRRLTEFHPGDTVCVQVRIKEGERERLQNFEGMVIAKRNRGFRSSITLRKISSGVAVERVFPANSPAVVNIEKKRSGKVRRAKLYYLRGTTGKSARVKSVFRRKSDTTSA